MFVSFGRIFLFVVANGFTFLPSARTERITMIVMFFMVSCNVVIVSLLCELYYWPTYERNWGFVCVSHLSVEVGMFLAQIETNCQHYGFLYMCTPDYSYVWVDQHSHNPKFQPIVEVCRGLSVLM